MPRAFRLSSSGAVVLPISNEMMAAIPELDRRRLVEVRGLHPAVPVLVLHPLLTVVTGFGRDPSDTVVECLGRLGAPLGPAVTGFAEIGGRILELPGALADPDARPEVVRSPMIVGELSRRRAADAAADLSKRAARVSRREAGLARRDQLVDRLERLSSRADALEAQLHPTAAIDDEEIGRLLAAARVPDLAEPNPIVTAMIDEWDALVAERKASGSGPTAERAEANLDAIRARIAERRLAVAGGDDSEILSAEGVARVQELHAELEQLAASLEEGRRSERKAAGPKVVAALDAEREALAELGFDSYPAFLLAMAEGRGEDDADHDAAALQTAEAALMRARERESVFVVLSERELDLRARVARLLGRLPGPDVGAELRNGREMLPASGAMERLEAALRKAEIPAGDPIEAAERWLAGNESRRAQRSALTAELAEIESEGCRLDEQLEQAEDELAAAERELIAGVSGSLAGREAPVVLGSVAPDELAAALAALLAPAGPPVVFGECFTELTPLGCAALLEVLGETSRRRQVIIVTEHEGVGTWAEGLGLDGVVWTPAEMEEFQREARSKPTALQTAAVDEQVDESADDDDTQVAEVVVEAFVGMEAARRAVAPEVPEVEVAEVADVVEADVADVVEASDPVEVVDAPPEPVEVVDAPPELVEVVDAPPELVEVVDAPPEPVVRIVPPVPEAPVVPVVPEVVESPVVESPDVVEAPEPAADDGALVAETSRRIGRRRKPKLYDVEAVEAAEAAAAAALVAEAAVAEAAVAEAEVVEAEVVEIAPEVAPRRPAAPPAPVAPAAKRSDGPWKSKRARRKSAAESAAPPWDGRFDTARDRTIPGRLPPPPAPPPGTEPLAVCARHRGVLTRKRCARCAEPMCEDCLVMPGGRRKPICIECAILESGVRKRRRRKH